MRKFLNCIVAAALSLCGCSGGGGAASGTSNPAAGTYAGVITDDAGTPVAGARVSVDGIEAQAVTGSDGSFLVSDPDLSTAALAAQHGDANVAAAATVEVSVLAPGFTPHVGLLTVGPGDRANVSLVSGGLVPDLTVSSPSDRQTFLVDDACEAPTVTVEGFAKLGLRDNFTLDVALVIDRSGSTANPAFDVDDDGNVDTVLEAEIAAARCFLETLDYSITRVCLLEFSDAAEVVVDFTSDADVLEDGLDSLSAPGGGTNFDAALKSCEGAFATLGAEDLAGEVPAEIAGGDVPAPLRAVVFLSDGIATAHGVPRDTTDSNLTQSAADRIAALDAAVSLGEATGAQLFAYSFIAANDANRKRTTLPHCVASCGGGSYKDLTDVSLLSDALCGVPLVSTLSVEISNVTTGSGAVVANLAADGFFSEEVPVALGPVEVVGAPDANGIVTNALQVTLRAFSGARAVSETKTVTVQLLAAATSDTLTAEEIFEAQTGAVVSTLENLRTPSGRAILRNNLQELLVGFSRAMFEDAVELLGTSTFTATDPAQPTVTVTVDVIFKEACYASDFGYFLMDPNDPPTSARQVLKDIPAAQVLFNTGDVGTGCGGATFAAGTQSFPFTVDAGSTVAFFMIPNRTLAQYKAQPGHQLKPLFTLPKLNQGGQDQSLEFRSLAGRTEEGASETVVTAGPLLVLAFEDIAIARQRSDQDFDDLVFTVRADTPGTLASAGCEDD